MMKLLELFSGVAKATLEMLKNALATEVSHMAIEGMCF